MSHIKEEKKSKSNSLFFALATAAVIYATGGTAALALAGSSAAAGIASSEASSQQQRRALRLQQRQADIQNVRAKRKALARTRQLRAQVEARAEASGTTGSPTTGALGALQTQTFANVSFQNTLSQLENQRLSALRGASGFASQAATFGAIAGLPGQLGFLPKG